MDKISVMLHMDKARPHRRRSFGLTPERAAAISRATEAAYRKKYPHGKL